MGGGREKITLFFSVRRGPVQPTSAINLGVGGGSACGGESGRLYVCPVPSGLHIAKWAPSAFE